MKAAVKKGKGISIENIPDPKIIEPGDAIVRITKAAICGSDLHIYRGHFELAEGDGLGHEFVGVVEDVGKDVHLFRKGMRVIGPFWVSCGDCDFCDAGLTTSCIRGSCFGFGDILGGNGGCQAEYVRVPYADGTLFEIPDPLVDPEWDERMLFLGDNIATGYHGAVRGEISPGDTIVVMGDGAVGLFAVYGATLFGPGRVIAIGHHDYRLDIARQYGADDLINSNETDALEFVKDVTDGRGADVVIEAVGNSSSMTDSINMVRPGGTVSALGLFWEPYEMNLTDMFLRNITVRAGVAPSRAYIPELLPLVENEKFDPTLVISHRISLDEVPRGYELMDKKQENAVKVVIDL